MAFDTYIKIDGAPGETTDDDHSEWIEVKYFNWGVNQESIGERSGVTATAGRATYTDFTFTHEFDKAAPKLFQLCTTGTHVDSIEIECCRAVGEKKVFLKYELGNTIVTEATTEADPTGESPVPIQTVSLNFGSIKETYTQYDHNDGSSKGNVEYGWDREANKAL